MRWMLLAVMGLCCAPAAHADRAPVPVSTINMPPGWAWPPTAAMRDRGRRCLAALDRAGVQHELLTRSVGRVATPVVVPEMRFGGLLVRPVYRRTRPPVMDCHMALTLVQHAPLLVELGVRELVTGGFYRNRRARLRGQSVALLSRHALGLAVDIRAFVFSDGRALSVKRDYRHPLLGRIEHVLAGSGGLRALVTPKNDRNHRNHFHISAKMTLDDAHPDDMVDIAELFRRVQQHARRARRRGRLAQ